MKQRPGQVLGLAVPFRAAGQRFALGLLVAAAVALMIVGHGEILAVERARVVVLDALAPILDALSRPAATIADISRKIEEIASIREENIRLRAESASLMHAQMELRRLKSENAALRGLLNFLPDPQTSFVSGRVIADSGGAFMHSVLLNAGQRTGIRKGQAAVTGEGLVGRVTDAGERSARILLLTDMNSHIPVVVESTRDRAILTGDNSSRPYLAYLPSNAPVSVGDRIVTSGHGGAFPPGLPVGVVASVVDNEARIEPFVNFNRLEFVRVVDFGLTGILPPPIHSRAEE